MALLNEGHFDSFINIICIGLYCLLPPQISDLGDKSSFFFALFAENATLLRSIYYPTHSEPARTVTGEKRGASGPVLTFFANTNPKKVRTDPDAPPSL